MGNKYGVGSKRPDLAAANRSRQYSSEIMRDRQKKSATARRGKPGKIPSPETRLKLSLASRGKPKSAEHRANIAAGLRGKPNMSILRSAAGRFMKHGLNPEDQ